MSDSNTAVSERPLPTTVAEALRATADVLRQQGRTRGRNFWGGKVCLNGALLVAIGLYEPNGETRALVDGESQRKLYYVAGRALHGTAYNWGFGDAVAFNDYEATTDKQVFELIEAAVARAEAIETAGN
jgi:hypothetical protein